RLYLDSKVFSGPWLGGFNFGLAKIDTMISFTAVDTSKSLENQYIGVAHTLVGWTGRDRNQLSILPFEYTTEEGRVVFRGGTGEISRSGLDLTFPYYERQSHTNGARLTVENARIQMSVTGNLDLVSSVLNVDQITLVDERKGERFDFEGLFLDVQNEHMADGLLQSRLKGRVTLASGKESAVLELEHNAQNIDFVALKQMQALSSGTLLGNKEVEALMLRMMQAQPRMDFNLTLTKEGQTASIRSNFKLEEFDANKAIPNLLFLVLDKGRVQAAVKIPTSFMYSPTMGLTGDNQQWVSNMLQKGFLLEQGQDYVGQYSYDGKALMVNGKRVSLF
ncbi:MAG: DUF945 family protein, partial [Saezia sp.]